MDDLQKCVFAILCINVLFVLCILDSHACCIANKTTCVFVKCNEAIVYIGAFEEKVLPYSTITLPPIIEHLMCKCLINFDIHLIVYNCYV